MVDEETQVEQTLKAQNLREMAQDGKYALKVALLQFMQKHISTFGREVAEHGEENAATSRGRSSKVVTFKSSAADSTIAEQSAISTCCTCDMLGYEEAARLEPYALTWWAAAGYLYPILRLMARHRLVTPSSTAATERGWARSRFPLTVSRARLKPANSARAIFYARVDLANKAVRWRRNSRGRSGGGRGRRSRRN